MLHSLEDDPSCLSEEGGQEFHLDDASVKEVIALPPPFPPLPPLARSRKRLSFDRPSERGYWQRTAREASDTTSAMVDGWVNGSPASATGASWNRAELDSNLVERLLSSEEEETGSVHSSVHSSVHGSFVDDGMARAALAPSSSLVGGIAMRRRTRGGSARSSVGDSSAELEKGADSSPFGLAGEQRKARGALQTVQDRQEGAVKWKVWLRG